MDQFANASYVGKTNADKMTITSISDMRKCLRKETESKRKMMRVFGMRLNVLLQLYRLSSGSLRCVLFSCFRHTMQRVWQKKIGVDAGIGSTLMQQSKRTE